MEKRNLKYIIILILQVLTVNTTLLIQVYTHDIYYFMQCMAQPL